MSRIIRLNLIVEGQTEETFVKKVIAPHLLTEGIYCTPSSLSGMRKYSAVKKEINLFLRDSSAYLTTMFDLYALPNDFPGWSAAQSITDPRQKVEELEAAFGLDVSHERFIPYLQLYEFESLLFSDVALTDDEIKSFDHRSRLRDLQKIRNRFDSPEHINDGVQTAPSKRLKSLYPAYDKLVYGVLSVLRIGLPKLRAECRHFNDWLSKLESLEP